MPNVERDGVNLFYEEAGAGAPPVVFIHGWCCDHTYFQPQFDHFQSDHRVVSVDLRGHGQSDKPEGAYDMGTLAEDVAHLILQIGLDRPVVVGHSMGGVVALEAAARHGDLVRGVVMCDSPVLIPQAMRDDLGGFIEGLRSPAYTDVARGFVENMLFIPTDDPEVKARVAAAMSGATQHVMAGCMEGLVGWDGEAAGRQCRLPVLFIGADQVVSDLDRFRQACTQLEVEQTPGVGHFHQLLAPDRINELVAGFLARAAA